MLFGASDAGIETCLQVSNHFKDVPICMLSDDNFSEEEMEDLRDRIKVGLLKKMTVVELNLKAKILHEDIMKHWIAKELSLLQKLIDHANEKGRRRDLFELLERRKLLQKPSEQEKLLATIPKVTAEELVPDETLAVSSEKPVRNSCSPKSALRASDVSSADPSGFVNVIDHSQVSPNYSTPNRETDVRAFDIISVESRNGDINAQGAFKQVQKTSFEDLVIPYGGTFKDWNVATEKDGIDTNCATPFEDLNRHENYCETLKQVEETSIGFLAKLSSNSIPSLSYQNFEFLQLEQPTPSIIGNVTTNEMPVVDSKEIKPQQNSEKAAAPTEVIELSDDESEPEDQMGTNEMARDSSGNDIWHYLDPQGQNQGPFSLDLLKRWSDYNYFHSGFRVWKTGQSQNEGVLLIDVLRRTFPS